jgi:hypothetical protein
MTNGKSGCTATTIAINRFHRDAAGRCTEIQAGRSGDNGPLGELRNQGSEGLPSIPIRSIQRSTHDAICCPQCTSHTAARELPTTSRPKHCGRLNHPIRECNSDTSTTGRLTHSNTLETAVGSLAQFRSTDHRGQSQERGVVLRPSTDFEAWMLSKAPRRSQPLKSRERP